MTVITSQVLFQRNILTCVLVLVFVISIVAVTISLYVAHPPDDLDGEKTAPRPNILFIVADDLRPALGCYGDKIAITPNIDQLAKKSIKFRNAYVQQALCAPSRTSFLTSRRPDTLHLYDNNSYWRNSVGNFITLPQHFKNHGYHTISIGKIFHHGVVSNHTDDFPYSWSNPPFHPPTLQNKMAKVCPSADGKLHMNLVCPVDISKQPGKKLPDIESTQYAINYLKNKKSGNYKNWPFFLGVGYYKPHIPFKFPKEYLDLYPLGNMDLAPFHTLPKDLPEVAWNPWCDLREREDVQAFNVSFPFGPLPEEFQKLARQGYYASVSYMDDLLGQLLETLESSGYASNTVIIFIGDHGWSLGEHQEWAKYSNFEVALKVPLLVHIPGETDEGREPFKYIPLLPKNKTTIDLNKAPKFIPEKNNTFSSNEKTLETDEFVELVDLFPSLSEIANIAVPSLCKVNISANQTFCSEGISFKPVIDHLIRNKYYRQPPFTWKTAVFSQYPRPSKQPMWNSDQPALEDITIMGYTIRTKAYRYTEWVLFDPKTFKPQWGFIVDQELYDKTADPDENSNLANEPQYSDLVIELSQRLKKGWRAALPPNVFGSPKKNRHLKKKVFPSNVL